MNNYYIQVLLLAGRGSSGKCGLRRGSCSGGRGLTGNGILGSELGKVGAKSRGKLTTLEPLGELLACGDVGLVSTGRGDQPAEDAPLGHLESLGHGWDACQGGWQPRYVGLHVGQKLLQLVKNLKQKTFHNCLRN